MDFTPDTGLAEFRSEVREFLRVNVPDDLAHGEHSHQDSVRLHRENVSRWQRILNSHGWGAPYWPKEHGGTGWTAQQRLVFDEECALAGAQNLDIFAHHLLGPALNEFGSPEQKAQHMPAIFEGTSQWCQGFSEPGAGSDLAALRTSAVREDDHYVINGQKIWTSYAHMADWIFLLARTSSEGRKQEGITFLLVDMTSPGITVRPIISIDGCHHLNETFFDNVRVPVSNRVGREGQGWEITKFLLNNEHAATADLPAILRYQRLLHERCRKTGMDDEGGVRKPELLLRLARIDCEVRAVAMMVRRVAKMEQDRDPRAHVMGSMLKVRGTELQQTMTEFLVEAEGEYGAVSHAEKMNRAGMASEMFFRRASTIYGGASEVQRGIIAKMLFQF
jgi:acyl-CoA dehydrogenase